MAARPSLKALNAFSAVVRAGSVAGAARALHVSPSAVSHLLAELERVLGVALFAPGRKSELTEAGARLARGLGTAFEAIDTAVDAVLRRGGDIRVSTLTTFYSLWLVHRLGRFHGRHPQARVFVSTTTRLVDLAAEPFDCAIRHGRGAWAGVEAHRLMRETLALVAAPRLLDRAGVSVADLAGLFGLPRLAAVSRPDDWPQIAAAAGLPLPRAEPVLMCDNRAFALQAAVLGVGVMVADRALISAHLAAGDLVAAPVAVECPEAHYFVARPAALRDRHVRDFRDWLVAECRADET